MKSDESRRSHSIFLVSKKESDKVQRSYLNLLLTSISFAMDAEGLQM